MAGFPVDLSDYAKVEIEEEANARPIERTKPKFPSFGPADGTGRTWHEYFTELRGLDRVDESDTDGDEPGDDLFGTFAEVVITTPGHEVESGWPRTIATWRNRLLAHGWQVKVGNSVAKHPDSYYKNGKLKKPAHEEQQWWVNAAKPDRYITISYNYENGKPVGNRTTRRVRGILKSFSDAEMQDAIEAEDE